MDPASLATLGAPLLHEAIKTLVGLAGDALRSWRERRKAQAAPTDSEGEAATAPAGEAVTVPASVPATVDVPDILEGTPAPIEYHLDRVGRLEAEIKDLRRALSDHAEGIEPVDPGDAGLVEAADALRRALEAVTGQRITFRGEDRPASGPIVDSSVDVDEVLGYVAGVRARVVAAGMVTSSVRARTVGPGGQVVGVDVDRIG